MPKETTRPRKSKEKVTPSGTIYKLEVKFDAEDLRMLQALEADDRQPRAALLKRYMREEYRRRHPGPPK